MRFILAILFAGLSSLSFSQTTKTNCLDCHNDKTLTQDRNGTKVSLYVDPDHFKKSVHGELDCTDCHTGFDAENIPHKEGNNISKVDCKQCHETQDYAKSIHGTNNVACFSCHSKHDIQPAATVKKAEADLCISCHKSSSVSSYKKSIHFQKFSSGAKAPICTDCHNKTAHKIQKADFNKSSEEKLCSACHKHSLSEFSQSVHKLAKQENTPGCVSCHGAHEVYNNKYSISSQSCLKCHLDQSKFKNKKSDLVEFVQHYRTSIHAKVGPNGKEAATCIDCHGDHTVMGTDAAKSMIARQNIPQTCGKCHADVLKDYKVSAHGVSFAKGVKVAPTCIDCHGEHTISAVKESPLGTVAEKDICYNCHVKNPEVIKMTGGTAADITKYEKSAHFIALKNGNLNAPTCSDCHTGHRMQAANVKGSNINKLNVAASCGKESGCHSSITALYNESVHGQAVKKGVAEAPTCTNCHGNHQIVQKNDPLSRVSHGQQVVMLCSSCHSDVQLSRKYNLPETQSLSYMASYHGLAVRGGSKFAADCASCHGSHNIKPSSDPTSTINRRNLSVTCGKCHPGANIASEFRKVHLMGTKEESSILYWIINIYMILIITIIGGMVMHNILDLIRKRQEKKHHKKEIEELKKQGKVYLRMSLSERIQHFIMLTSFISLVITGFALKYPESWWVISARTVLGDLAFQARSLAHRFFGISMILVSLYHAYYLAFTKRGRQLFMDFLPNLQDAKDVIVNIKYLLGISKERPQFDRFSYMEKAEYWALVWGVAIMSASGLVLMFNNFFLSIAPKIMFDIATLVHLYEAWLATLAIIVWHFYYVIFNPEVYPINKAFIKGTMSEEEMMSEHPLELERIKNDDEQQKDERILRE
ncbi:MAG: cytochrome c3 family protein [Bacteroidota bacterium]|nr:cytochrome c3 family protein [Bacteroidota bacterium]